MTDEELHKLLLISNWRLVYAKQNDEEWTGARNTKAPTLIDIKNLLRNYDAVHDRRKT